MRLSKGVRVGVVFAATLAGLRFVDAAGTQIGSWHVTIEKDPFSTKKKTVAGLIDVKRQGSLALRCFPEGGLSAVVVIGTLGKQFEPGTKVHFKYRADEGEIADEEGEAFGERLVELPIARKILTDAALGKTIYVRMQSADEAELDLSFVPRLSTRALAQINSDCPSEKPSEPDKANGKAEKRSEGSGQKAVARALGISVVPDVSGGTGRTWVAE